MDVGITVEELNWDNLIAHGAASGLIGGIALGLIQFIITAAQHKSALYPFRLVAALVLGPSALTPDASTAVVITLGIVFHMALAVVYGVIFAMLLGLMFQLSARVPLLILYGMVFGFLLWEVNFMAILPGLYPDLAHHFGLVGQVWKGIVAYTLVYGPALAVYMIIARPGVVSDWKEPPGGAPRD